MQICTNKFIHNQQDVATVVNDFSYLFSTIGINLQNSLAMYLSMYRCYIANKLITEFVN